MKKGAYKTLIGVLIVLEVFFLHLSYKSYSNTPVEENKEIHETKRKQFSSYIKSGNSYVAYTGNEFYPTGYKINLDKSGCVDINGNKLEGVLTSIDKSVTVRSNKTAFCHLYFDKILTTSDLSSEKMESSGLEGDGKRYFGTNPDNYICFGTDNMTTCKNEPDKYMYRIIGAFKDAGNEEHLKLIKKEVLESTLAWNNTNEDIDWGDSTLFSALNGSSFLNNTNYVPLGWSSKIASWTWTSTNTKTNESSGVYYYYTSPRGIYYSETAQNQTQCRGNTSSTGSLISCTSGRVGETTSPAKIGLMNVSDYALSLGGTQLTTDTSTQKGAATLKTGWMHISNNDSSAPNATEWTISRDGYDSTYDFYRAWAINSSVGNVVDYSGTNTYSVRPVFYLNSDVVIIDGQGTIDSPYIIG